MKLALALIVGSRFTLIRAGPFRQRMIRQLEIDTARVKETGTPLTGARNKLSLDY